MKTIQEFKREYLVRELKRFCLELVLNENFKNGFVLGFNDAVKEMPELIIDLDFLNECINESHGLASHGMTA